MAEWAPLRDYSRSRAVVMGTWEYEHLPQLPAAEFSLRRMERLLTGPLCGWPQERLVTVANERGSGDLPDRLISAFDGIVDVALFYFVGQGQISVEDQLCLGVQRSRMEPRRRATTSLQFADVRHALLESDAAFKIVILDCCFAGLATSGLQSGPAGHVVDLAAGSGAYTIAATYAYAAAWYEDEPSLAEPQTYFTKYLADLVEQGIPGQPSQLRLETLFRRLHDDLAADGRPVPMRRSVDDAREFVFAHNACPPLTEFMQPPADASSQQDLLFRIYIPAERLYADEADRILALFRDWLNVISRHGVRQSGYRTTAGSVYEFYADSRAARWDRDDNFAEFTRFLQLCSANPSSAVDALASTKLGPVRSADFVARFAREVRRLQVDLTHERERRILAIRHDLEEQLVADGIDLGQLPTAQIGALIDHMVPGPSPADPLALIAAPHSPYATAPITLNISQQFVSATESTVIQNLHGTSHFGSSARVLLDLIHRLGGEDAPFLEAAVHELEDTSGRPADRSAARQRLKKFLNKIAETVHEVSIDVLERYLETKLRL